MKRACLALWLVSATVARAAPVAPPTLAGATSLDQRLQQLLTDQPLDGPVVSLGYLTTVRLSLDRNVGLARATEGARVTSAALDEAKAARNPTFTAVGYYSHQDPNLTRAIRPDVSFIREAEADGINASHTYISGQNQMLNRATLYVPIYTGGLLESAIHVQRALAEAAGLGLKRTRELVAYITKQQYLAALLAREDLDVARQTVVEAGQIEKVADAKLKTGTGTKVDILQARVARRQAEDAVVKTNSSWEKAQADLAGLLDLPVLTRFNLKDSLQKSDYAQFEPVPSSLEQPGAIADQDLKQLVQLALGQRPELDVLRQQLVANHERMIGASSGLLPKLSQNVEYDLIGYTETLRGGLMLISNLSIPIFDGGVSRAKILEFRLRDLQLKNGELQEIVGIALEVEAAQLGLTESRARLSQALVADSGAREALRISKLRYDVGAGDSLELVTSETTLANAQFELARARYRVLVSLADLSLALGQKV